MPTESPSDDNAAATEPTRIPRKSFDPGNRLIVTHFLSIVLPPCALFFIPLVRISPDDEYWNLLWASIATAMCLLSLLSVSLTCRFFKRNGWRRSQYAHVLFVRWMLRLMLPFCLLVTFYFALPLFS